METVVLDGNLYNILNGIEPTAGMVLTVLGIGQTQIGRFRDAYITYLDDDKTEPVFVIMTRTGHSTYQRTNEMLRNLPSFIECIEDATDRTFLLFHYRVPESYRERCLNHLSDYGPPKSRATKMAEAMARPPTNEQLKIANDLKAALEKSPVVSIMDDDV